MSFWKKWFEGEPQAQATPYSTFDKYVKDEPISIYFNREKIAELPKTVEFHETDKGFRYEISYNKKELDEILTAYGVDNIKLTKIFNGIDINVYAGRVPVTQELYNKLPITVNFEGLESETVEYHVDLIETTADRIIYDFDYQHILDTLSLENLKWFNQQSVKKTDDGLVFTMTLKDYIYKPVLLDYLKVGEIKTELHIHEGHVIADIFDEDELDEMIQDKLKRLCLKVASINRRHIPYQSDHEVVYIRTDYDTDRLNQSELELLNQFVEYKNQNDTGSVSQIDVIKFLIEKEAEHDEES